MVAFGLSADRGTALRVDAELSDPMNGNSERARVARDERAPVEADPLVARARGSRRRSELPFAASAT
jgi:hypothetical protein